MTKTQLKKIIGDNIRAARVARGITINELADLLQMTPGYVGFIERGERGANIYILYKLASILDLSVDSFLCEKRADRAPDSTVQKKNNEKPNARKYKISSLTIDFNDDELDFLINIIKNMRTLNLTK